MRRESTVDLGPVRDKAALLAVLARALALPSTFGHNWDALADALQDLPLGPEGLTLDLRRARAAKTALGDEWATLLEILSDAAMYWKERGIAFEALIDGAPPEGP